MLKKISYLVFILVLNFNLSVYSSDASKSPDDDFDSVVKSLNSQQSTSDGSSPAAAAVAASSFQVALSPATLQLPEKVTKTLMTPFFVLFNALLKNNKKDLQAGYAVVKADCGQASKKAALLTLAVICAYYGLRNFADGSHGTGATMTILGLAGILYGGSLIDHISKK